MAWEIDVLFCWQKKQPKLFHWERIPNYSADCDKLDQHQYTPSVQLGDHSSPGIPLLLQSLHRLLSESLQQQQNEAVKVFLSLSRNTLEITAHECTGHS